MLAMELLATLMWSFVGLVMLMVGVCSGLPFTNSTEDIELEYVKNILYCPDNPYKFSNKQCDGQINVTGCYYSEGFKESYSCDSLCNDVEIGTLLHSKCVDRCTEYINAAPCEPAPHSTTPHSTAAHSTTSHSTFTTTGSTTTTANGVDGGLVGGLVTLAIILIIIMCIYLCLRRKRSHCCCCAVGNRCMLCKLLDCICCSPCQIKASESSTDEYGFSALAADD